MTKVTVIEFAGRRTGMSMARKLARAFSECKPNVEQAAEVFKQAAEDFKQAARLMSGELPIPDANLLVALCPHSFPMADYDAFAVEWPYRASDIELTHEWLAKRGVVLRNKDKADNSVVGTSMVQTIHARQPLEFNAAVLKEPNRGPRVKRGKGNKYRDRY